MISVLHQDAIDLTVDQYDPEEEGLFDAYLDMWQEYEDILEEEDVEAYLNDNLF